MMNTEDASGGTGSGPTHQQLPGSPVEQSFSGGPGEAVPDEAFVQPPEPAGMAWLPPTPYPPPYSTGPVAPSGPSARAGAARGKSRLVAIVLVSALAGGLAGAGAGYAVGNAKTSGGSFHPIVRPVISAPEGKADRVSAVAQAVLPVVVRVDVTQRGGRDLFGRGQTVQGTGSGVIISADGHIITNNHVVEGVVTGGIEVTLASGEKVAAVLVGQDPETDLAVIKVDRKSLPVAVLGKSKDLKVGELAVAVGSPFGLEGSVTAGIISALHRFVAGSDNSSPILVNAIQTDAAINPGNSGGALANSRGEIIGINSAIASGGAEQNAGVGFAIPIDEARSVAEALVKTGRVEHPYVGILGEDLTPEAARQFGLPTDQGAIIAQVVPGGPAEKAGLKEGDIIVAIDGAKMSGFDEVVVDVRQHQVGDTITFEILRQGKRESVKVTLAAKPSGM